MTGYTPIYNLPYPQASDLVSAYPGTGQDLAEEVETVLAAKAALAGATYTGTHDFTGATVTGIPQGLVLITSATFTSASAVNVNNCFSGTYENYRLVVSYTGSTGLFVNLKLRAGGTDTTDTTYKIGGGYSLASSVGGANASGQSAARVGAATTVRGGAAGDILTPALAVHTTFIFSSFDGSSANFDGSTHQTATAYDGFSLIPSTGNITGRYTVFGYRLS